MNTVMLVLVLLAAFAVLATLIAGVVTMFRGGEFARAHSNRLMRWRVILQGVALLILFVAFLVKSRSG